ncbi:MAG: hypothetical protein FD138_4 [Planctomycetota bacterium]|nr:MAG: hypothetical protein FD138_4 [Planctomycetota bacterium]
MIWLPISSERLAMPARWKGKFSGCVVAALVWMCALGCQGHAQDSAGENANLIGEQVAELDGPFVSADFVVNRETNDSCLVTCSKDGVIRTFDLKGREQEQWKIDDPIGQVFLFTASSPADAYAAIGDNGVVVFGRLSRAETIARGTSKVRYMHLKFSIDGKWVAAFSEGAGQVWSSDDWTECPAFTQEKGVSDSLKEALAFLKEGDQTRIATAGFQSNAIEVRSVPSGNLDRTLDGDERQDRRFEDLASTPDSRYVVAVKTGSEGLAVFDVASGKIVARPRAFPTGIGNRLAISGNGKTLVCSQFLHSSRSRTGFRVYQIDGWMEMGRVEVKDDVEESEFKKLRVCNLAIDSTGTIVATLHESGQIRLWKLPSK